MCDAVIVEEWRTRRYPDRDMSASPSKPEFDDLPRIRPLRRGETSLWSSYAAHAYDADEAGDVGAGELVVVDSFPSSLSDTADIVAQARRLVGVRHPNLSTVRRVGSIDGDAIVVSDFFEGERLDALETSEMSIDVSIRVVIDALAALSALHDLGIVHGHVEPQNVIVGLDGVTKLVRGYIGPGRLLVIEGGAMHRVAPEVLRKGDIDVRADVYGAGVLLKELVGDASPSWAARLAGVVVTAMSVEPRDRYASVADMARALRVVAQSHVATATRTADFVDGVAGDRIIARRGALAVPSERRLVSRAPRVARDLMASEPVVATSAPAIVETVLVRTRHGQTTAMLRAAVKRWSRTTLAIAAFTVVLACVLTWALFHAHAPAPVTPAPTAIAAPPENTVEIPAPPSVTAESTIELPDDPASPHPRPAHHHAPAPKKPVDRSAIF